MKTLSLSMMIILLTTLLVMSCGKSGNNGANGVGSSNSPIVSGGIESASPTPTGSSGASKKPATPEELEQIRIRQIDPGKVSLSPGSGVTKSAVTVTLACPVPEAKIVYTLDGSDPKPNTGKIYTTPLTISTSTILKARSFVPNGQSSPVIEADYTIGEICVANGSKGNGSRSLPLGSIKAALEMAASSGISTIKVATGSYNENLELKSALSISGGWSKNFSKKTGDKSIVQGNTQAGGSKKTPGYAIKISGTNTADLKLERLDIRGGEANYSAGLFVTDSATPTIISCALTGGSGSYGYGAIVTGSANPNFTLCQFDGGTSPSSTGLSIDSAMADLYSCISAAGSGNVSGDGTSLTDSKITAYNSVFAGSAANTSHGVAMYNTKGSSFESCTIWGGSGNDATALFISVGNPIVSSCIIASAGKKTSYGIYHNYGLSAPSVLKNTAFSGCATGIYFDADTRIAYSTINDSGKLSNAAGKVLAAPVAEASLTAELNLGPAPFCKTPHDAPAGVVNGGLTSTASNIDAGGTKRTAPWAIGAWEIER